MPLHCKLTRAICNETEILRMQQLYFTYFHLCNREVKTHAQVKAKFVQTPQHCKRTLLCTNY